MVKGVGAGGSAGDEGWARVADGSGKATVRKPSWRERENNRRRERRRRVIWSRIFAGLRKHGNYALPRQCDNNIVLMALCEEAGWTVEADGTIYRRVAHADPSSLFSCCSELVACMVVAAAIFP